MVLMADKISSLDFQRALEELKIKNKLGSTHATSIPQKGSGDRTPVPTDASQSSCTRS